MLTFALVIKQTQNNEHPRTALSQTLERVERYPQGLMQCQQ